MKPFLHIVNPGLLEKEWLELPSKLHKSQPGKPFMLIDDVRKIFDRDFNSILQQGESRRWIAYDEYNLCAGRIAAYHDGKSQEGQVGFFETTNNKVVADALFNAAVGWLSERGSSTAYGPVNFGEKDRFWGLLTGGFETKGLYLDNYNPPYYRDLFRAFGFETAETIHTYRIDPCNIPVDHINRIADWSEKKSGYSVRQFSWKEKSTFAEHIHHIYTSSFREDTRIKHLTTADILQMLEMVRLLLDEKFCWFAFKENKPLAFLLCLNEPDNIFKKNGSLRRLKGFAFATVPEMRGKGIDTSLARALQRQLTREPFQYEVMLSGINNKTTKMNSLINKIGGKKIKLHETFQYKIKI
jgi:hypothetical protein